MPRPIWTHYCLLRGEDVRTGQETCPTCGVGAEFQGWCFSMIERMGMYQRRTGFKPIGPHRGLADLLLAPLLRTCARCGGEGLVDSDQKHYLLCPACEGRMSVRSVSDELFEGTRRRITREYPDSTAPM